MSDDRAKISHVYAGNPLDRGDRERRDEQWLADRARDPTSKFLPMWDLNVPITDGAEGALGWLSFEDLTRIGVDAVPVFLGISGQAAHFVVDISKYEDAVRELKERGDWVYQDARTATEFLSGAESGIVAQARAQINWHNRNGFCSICGHETVVLRGGQVRQCSQCKIQNYPRTDPVVITVVSDGDRCLLGRSRGRGAPVNRYSALAGFVDQGESIEEAVAREIMEEAGIRISNIRYHSSQPWPFPSSLMIGCHARAVTTDISMDEEEMADVRWFQREEVLRALDGTSEDLVVPGPIAIAHHLIKAWATGG
ncbi:MAG: NAD(+) diphosphatase [Chloroflexi bacterium]|nr:NAD(+) diphosphatase [Chloroflexota bacterium]MCI0787555.1 NAD(+) diphosphatase [Chloroflexota bacterium]